MTSVIGTAPWRDGSASRTDLPAMSETPARHATATDARVAIDVDDHVAEVRLTRPDKHNALDAAMFEGIVAADRAGRGDARRARRGAARRGAELLLGARHRELHDRPGLHRRPARARRGAAIANLAQRVAYDWTQLPVPVIAAVHGACFGGGLQIALGADIRIAAPDARLSVMEIRWGLVPDMAITQTLPRLVPIDVAKELVFTGRRLSGEEAQAARPRHARRGGPARRRARAGRRHREPLARRDPRRQAPAAGGVARPSRAAALLLESELQTALIGSPNQLAAVTAGLTKEPAEFDGPA